MDKDNLTWPGIVPGVPEELDHYEEEQRLDALAAKRLNSRCTCHGRIVRSASRIRCLAGRACSACETHLLSARRDDAFRSFLQAESVRLELVLVRLEREPP